MKKLLFIASAVLVLSGCAADEKEIKSGVYALQAEESEETALNPYLKIDSGEERFEFFFDGLSSYMNSGEYSADGEKLICQTDDGKYNYVFEIKDDAFVFDEASSSSVEPIDDSFAIKVTDGAEFKIE